MKTVADKHRHAAYHNKHWYPHKIIWFWMTLNPQGGLMIFFAIFRCRGLNCDEMDGERSRLLANRNWYRLSRVSWALDQISCYLVLTYLITLRYVYCCLFTSAMVGDPWLEFFNRCCFFSVNSTHIWDIVCFYILFTRFVVCNIKLTFD